MAAETLEEVIQKLTGPTQVVDLNEAIPQYIIVFGFSAAGDPSTVMRTQVSKVIQPSMHTTDCLTFDEEDNDAMSMDVPFPSVWIRVVTRPDLHVSVHWMSGRVRQPHGRLPDGMLSATPPGGRHGGWPSDRRSPAPTVSWMVNGRSVRQSSWWSASRADDLADPSAWNVPQGPSAKPKLWSPITIDLEV
jgi:hypothetical protein